MQSLKEKVDARLETVMAELEVEQNRMSGILIVTLVSIAVLTSLLVFFLLRVITRSLKEAVVVSERIALRRSD